MDVGSERTAEHSCKQKGPTEPGGGTNSQLDVMRGKYESSLVQHTFSGRWRKRVGEEIFLIHVRIADRIVDRPGAQIFVRKA